MTSKRRKSPLRPEEKGEFFKRARLIDDLFMRTCLRDAPECLELIARAATGIDTLAIDEATFETQADMKSLVGRSLEMDFVVRDYEGRIYNVEIESGGSTFIPKRARYHSSLLDSRALQPGEKFDDLPDSYVIVISEDDKLGTGQLLTTVRRYTDHQMNAFDDGSVILYVNCSAFDDSLLGRIAHDFLTADPDDMRTPQLASKVNQIKKREAGMPKEHTEDPVAQAVIDRNYENGFHDGRLDGREEGLQEGRMEGREEERLVAVSKIGEFLEKAGMDAEFTAQAKQAIMSE